MNAGRQGGDSCRRCSLSYRLPGPARRLTELGPGCGGACALPRPEPGLHYRWYWHWQLKLQVQRHSGCRARESAAARAVTPAMELKFDKEFKPEELSRRASRCPGHDTPGLSEEGPPRPDHLIRGPGCYPNLNIIITFSLSTQY